MVSPRYIPEFYAGKHRGATTRVPLSELPIFGGRFRDRHRGSDWFSARALAPSSGGASFVRPTSAEPRRSTEERPSSANLILRSEASRRRGSPLRMRASRRRGRPAQDEGVCRRRGSPLRMKGVSKHRGRGAPQDEAKLSQLAGFSSHCLSSIELPSGSAISARMYVLLARGPQLGVIPLAAR